MSASAPAIMAEMFYDSRQSFARLADKSPVLLPLLAVTLGTALMYYWYFATVDFDWLVNHTLAASPDLTAQQREATREMLTLPMLMWSTVGMTLVLTPLLFALFAGYYLLADGRSVLERSLHVRVSRLKRFPLGLNAERSLGGALRSAW